MRRLLLHLRRLLPVLRWAFLAVALAAVGLAIDDATSRPSPTAFDPARLGKLEASMWRSYYEHRWVALALDGLRVSRQEYGLSLWDGTRSSILAARAASRFRGDTDDPLCLPLLERYYGILREGFGADFDTRKAARLELEWWRERRRKIGPGDYAKTLAANAALVYGLEPEALLATSRKRARAMDYRDLHGRGEGMTEEHWQEVTRQLEGAYTALKAALTDGEYGFLHNGVTAHRGSSLEHPENTLRAFRHALELGADWIELDIFTTADGHLVVHHDATTAATSDRDLVIGSSTLEELRQLDVAHRFRESRGLSREDCPPERMPLLSEALDLILEQRRTRLSIQPKDDSVETAVRLVEEKGAVAWCGFNDGNLAKMRRVKELVPALAVFWDRPAKFDLEADLATARELAFEAVVVRQDGVDATVVERIQAAGFEAGAWTVNDPARMRELLGLGIDRLYTDDVRGMLRILREKEAE